MIKLYNIREKNSRQTQPAYRSRHFRQNHRRRRSRRSRKCREQRSHHISLISSQANAL